MGYEALSEIVISRLLKKSNIDNYVRYEPAFIHDNGKTLVGCASNNFRLRHEQIVSFERLHRAFRGVGLASALAKFLSPVERVRYTADFVEEVTGLHDVGAHLTTILELDAIFLNEDRHTNNLAVIRDDEQMVFRLCPIFDNGLALLSDTNDYPLDEDVYTSIDKVHAKPFSDDFNEQLLAAEELYGSPLKLHFTKKDVDLLLAELEELYPPSVIKRMRKVLYEQMRRYIAYFE